MKLLKQLYNLKQRPNNFFEQLKARFFCQGYRQRTNHPCLGQSYLCCFADDCLFFSEKNKVIEEAVQQSRDAELDINVEEDVAGFLGISLEY